MNSQLKYLAAFAMVLGLASPAMARPGGGRHGPKLDRLVEKLNLDEATAAQVKAQFEAGKAESQALREQKKEARKAMHALMEAETPDRAAIMAQIEKIGAVRIALEKQRMSTMLEVRALLTPEQRAELKSMRKDRKGRKGHKGKRKGKHRRGGDDNDNGPEEE